MPAEGHPRNHARGPRGGFEAASKIHYGSQTEIMANIVQEKLAPKSSQPGQRKARPRGLERARPLLLGIPLPPFTIDDAGRYQLEGPAEW
jgi:hypothetical protein